LKTDCLVCLGWAEVRIIRIERMTRAALHTLEESTMPCTKETIFTMKAGVDVDKRFDGATVPIMAPANNAEMLELAGENAYIVFNRAYVLDVQKDVKEESQEEGATVESLREYARSRKFGQPRVRGQGTGRAIPKPAQVAAVLGDDFLATLTPEQRALYDSKMKEATDKAAAAKKEASDKKTAAPSTNGTTAAPEATKPTATPTRRPAAASK
jgi:hypothetical protein